MSVITMYISMYQTKNAAILIKVEKEKNNKMRERQKRPFTNFFE